MLNPSLSPQSTPAEIFRSKYLVGMVMHFEKLSDQFWEKKKGRQREEEKNTPLIVDTSCLDQFLALGSPLCFG
jgi:hypothetical protein